ncbi:MAG: hypothetical protein WC421_00710 [Elusimicrobiales bacterium]
MKVSIKPARRHARAAAAVALFAVLAVIVWRKLFFGGLVPADGNALAFFYPFTTAVKDAFARRELPLWNPLKNMGEPLLADPQAMMLYPPMWAAAALGYAGFVKFWVIFHFGLLFYFCRRTAGLAAAGGADAAAQAAGADAAGATGGWAALAGAVFIAFNPALISKITLLNYVSAAAWAAASLYFFMAGRLAAFSVSLALLWLAGFPPYCIIAALALAGLALWGRKAKLVFFAAGSALAAALSAAQWLPFLEMLRNSSRGLVLGPEQAAKFSVPLHALFTQVLVPPALKTPDFGAGDPAILSFYIGIPALCLAVYAAARDRRALLAALAGIAALVLSLGPTCPLYRLPLFNIFRFPAHWLLPAVFITGLLCARGIAGLRNGRLAALLSLLVMADVFAAAAALNSCAWVKPVFFTEEPPLSVIARDTGGRIYHTENYMRLVGARPLYEKADYLRVKETLLPSHGTAFGLGEARSLQEMRSLQCAWYLDRLEDAPDKRALLDAARITVVVDAAPGQGGAPEIILSRNAAARPPAFFDGPQPPPEYIASRNRLRARFAPGKDARLVFSQVNYPGWRATVDGKPVPPEDWCGFMSLRIPSGAREAQARYMPRSFIAGCAVSACAMLVLGLFLL